MQARTLQARGGLTARWCACAAAIATLMTCTIMGNTAVLLALRRTRRAPAHYPLASLAAADLLVGLFVVPIAAIRELFVVHLHWLICTSWETLDVLCCTASILSLCTLGWERWCGITAPLARARRAKRARLFAGLVWPVAFAVALPSAFIYTPKQHLETDKACPDNMNVSYVFVSAVLSFYIPASVMVMLYARILCALSVPPQIRAHRGRSPCPPMSPIGIPAPTATTGCSTPLPDRNLEEPQRNVVFLTPKDCYLKQPERSKHTVRCAVLMKTENGEMKSSLGGIVSRQRRATRTIVRLMAMFLACWTPFFVMLPADSVCDCVWDSIWQWSTWLGYMNSALNPLVYAAASPSVRQALQASITSSGRASEMQMTPNRRN